MATGEFKNSKGGYTVRTYWSSAKDIAGNFSTVTCDHYLDCGVSWDLYIGTRTGNSTVGSDSKDFTKDKISSGTAGGTHKLGTTTHKIPHDANGKKTVTATTSFPINATIGSTWYGTIEATGTMTLDDIPRASSVTVSNGTLNTAQKFKVTRNDNSFSHSITFSCGTVKDSVAVSKTTNLEPSWTPPLSLASQNTSGNKVTVTFTITTYNSAGTAIGTNTASAEYAIPSTVVPTCNATVTDGKGYLATYGGYVQGMSTFKVTVSGTPIYGSPIKSYRTIANGIPYNTATFETDAIKDFGSQTIEASVTDDRGNTGTKSIPVTVLEYYSPKLDIVAERCNADFTSNIEGNNFKVTANINVAPLSNKNKYNVTYKYRKSGETNYTNGELQMTDASGYDTGVTFIVPNIDADSSYEIEVTVTDNFGSVSRATVVGSAFTFLHFDGPTSNGIGRNKLNVLDDGIDVGGPIRNVDYSFENDIYTLIGSGSWMNTTHMISGVTAGDVIRFKTIILDSGGQVILKVWLGDNTDSTNIATLSYIDGATESYFEYTTPSDFQWLFVEFVDNNSTKSKDIRFKRPILTVNNADMTYERYILGVPPRLGIGKIAELDNGADFGLKARFNSGFEFPIIRQYTDLNTLLTPNFYIGENVADYQYINCPITGGTFYLEIVGAGVNRVRQTITTCSKLHSVTYERFYYDGAWGEWRDVYHGQEILYNNAVGTDGTVQLLHNAFNYTFLDIYFIDNNQKDGGCMKITSPSSKVLNFSMIEDGPSRSWIRRTSYVLSEYALTPTATHAGYVKLDGTTLLHDGIGTNYLRIVKVMGIR